MQSHSLSGREVQWSVDTDDPRISTVSNGRITFVINKRGSEDINDGSEFRAIRNAAATWENVATSTVRFLDQGLTSRNQTGNDDTNLIAWVEAVSLGQGIFALTTTTFDASGNVFDTDIQLNGFDFRWTTRGEAGRADVQHIVTHELGHVLQLDHSSVPGAAMRASTFIGDQSGRILKADDIAGASSIYPEAAFASSTGRILGLVTRNGATVFGVQVSAVPVGVTAGFGFVSGEIGAITLRGGAYELIGLPPGSYRLRLEAVDRMALGSFFRRDGMDVSDILPLTFPDTAIPEEGSLVVVRSGNEVTGINIEAQPGTTPDAFEPDSTFEQARRVAVDGVTRTHNFSTARDADTLLFSGRASSTYRIETSRLGPIADTILRLFDDQRRQLAENDDIDTPKGNFASRIVFQPQIDGEYFVQVTQFRPERAGGGASYDLKLTEMRADIQGRVISASSAATVAGATVRLGSLRTTTDGEGNFFFVDVPPEATQIEVSARGFEPAQQPFDPRDEPHLEITIELTPLFGSVAGKVTDGVSGRGVAGATVLVGEGRTRSNASGNFLVASIPAGRAELTVVAEGFLTFRDTVEVVGGDGIVFNPQLAPAPASDEPASPEVQVRLNEETYTTGDRLEVSIESTAGTGEDSFDLYLLALLPNGEVLFLDPSGQHARDSRPFQDNRQIEDGETIIFQHKFSGAEPAGGYTLIAGLVAAGADVSNPDLEIVSRSEVNFAFTP